MMYPCPLTLEEHQFIKAIECYKAEHKKTFLAWSEVLQIIKDLGYRRVTRDEPVPQGGASSTR